MVATWIVGSKLVAPTNALVGPPPAEFPASKIKIASGSGAILAGWYLPAMNSNATAILIHPIRGDRRAMLTRAKLFRHHGYSTLLIDLQAHGESTGESITMGYLEKYDVRAAIEFVRARDPSQKIVIVGRSLGGASTLFANPDVDLIVLESVYPTITEAIHNRIKMRMGFLHHIVAPLLIFQMNPRLGVSPDKLRPIDTLEQLRCPVVIASGDLDQHTTIAETNRMFEAANEPKKLVIFKGAKHDDLLAFDPSKYEYDIVRYIDQIIGTRNRSHEKPSSN